MENPVQCYICGDDIEPGEQRSDDHRVPKLLLKGAQPRRRGFDYGGVAPTHPRCNNEFRDEVAAGTALRILRAIHLPHATTLARHPDDPTLAIFAMNADVFGQFSEAEFAFFKMRNAASATTIPTPDEVRAGPKTNLLRQAVPIALSVLLKSSVALLVDRSGLPASGPRYIWAIPWTCDPAHAQDLRAEGFQPFHDEVLWKVVQERDLIQVRYYAHGVLVYFFLLEQPNMTLERQIMAAVPDADHWLFEGRSLRELRESPWKLIHEGAFDRGRNVLCGCGSGRRFKNCHGAYV
jgi:SEC-C motif